MIYVFVFGLIAVATGLLIMIPAACRSDEDLAGCALMGFVYGLGVLSAWVFLQLIKGW